MKLCAILLTALATVASAACADAQPGRKSQLATVTQLVDSARIEIVYRRPVARGRELFGSLVPWGKVWTPSADSAALIRTTRDLDVNGQPLRAGRYGIWTIPDSSSWTIIFTSGPAFHLTLPRQGDEVLRVRATPRAGEHMETLGFYFPMVDADSAVLHMHWGRTVVPLRIRAR
jgi:hypothetical protein